MAGLLDVPQQDIGGLLGMYLSRRPGDVFATRYGIPERTPFESEMSYFKANPTVAGMASEDNRVVMNPFSSLNGTERKSVQMNEAARVWMRQFGAPQFQLTPQQQQMLSGTTYSSASQDDQRSTIAARLLSLDPSAGQATPEQQQYIQQLRLLMGLR